MKAGAAATEIGASIGRSESAVKRKLDRLAGDKKPKPRPNRRRRTAAKARRKCLACGSTFKSEGIGNRICEACKESNRAIAHLEGVST
jgi:hypothetical protein